ncbi:uncharacterized protein LOC117639857 [Thrips palmi]|uniref:Uncharacterized protein LOC117639857 n=1 Tax=Thrips palmi TaxID=161013 RepID=A0A6P8Y6Q4_THRPL|nr:uncharacterized protein LOC117639857 [Thrips palmi]
MSRLLLLLCGSALWCAAQAYTGSDDRFVKKYAMMKVYESCFGPEVVREVRQEMRAASAKCQERAQSPILSFGPAFGQGPGPSLDRLDRPHHPVRTHKPQPQQQPQQQQQADSARLQQALMAVLNRQAQGGGFTAYRPVQQPQQPPAMPQVDPLQALQALQVLQQYQSRGSSHFHYQQPQPQPAYYQQSFGNRYSRSSRASKAMSSKSAPGPKRASSRASRDLDVQGQLETLTTRMTGRVKNVTCVMQELGYLDSALEPDFERIAARISRLPVSHELRRDMLDGVQFCRQFSQCIPDSRRDKFLLSGELLRPMFFFRCYKHKKLEACIMKDVRERYQQASVDDNLLPNTRAMDLDRDVEREGLDEDHMAAAVYEFLYGGDNLDADSFF